MFKHHKSKIDSGILPTLDVLLKGQGIHSSDLSDSTQQKIKELDKQTHYLNEYPDTEVGVTSLVQEFNKERALASSKTNKNASVETLLSAAGNAKKASELEKEYRGQFKWYSEMGKQFTANYFDTVRYGLLIKFLTPITTEFTKVTEELRLARENDQSFGSVGITDFFISAFKTSLFPQVETWLSSKLDTKEAHALQQERKKRLNILACRLQILEGEMLSKKMDCTNQIEKFVSNTATGIYAIWDALKQLKEKYNTDYKLAALISIVHEGLNQPYKLDEKFFKAFYELMDRVRYVAPSVYSKLMRLNNFLREYDFCEQITDTINLYKQGEIKEELDRLSSDLKDEKNQEASQKYSAQRNYFTKVNKAFDDITIIENDWRTQEDYAAVTSPGLVGIALMLDDEEARINELLQELSIENEDGDLALQDLRSSLQAKLDAIHKQREKIANSFTRRIELYSTGEHDDIIGNFVGRLNNIAELTDPQTLDHFKPVEEIATNPISHIRKGLSGHLLTPQDNWVPQLVKETETKSILSFAYGYVAKYGSNTLKETVSNLVVGNTNQVLSTTVEAIAETQQKVVSLKQVLPLQKTAIKVEGKKLEIAMPDFITTGAVTEGVGVIKDEIPESGAKRDTYNFFSKAVPQIVGLKKIVQDINLLTENVEQQQPGALQKIVRSTNSVFDCCENRGAEFIETEIARANEAMPNAFLAFFGYRKSTRQFLQHYIAELNEARKAVDEKFNSFEQAVVKNITGEMFSLDSPCLSPEEYGRLQGLIFRSKKPALSAQFRKASDVASHFVTLLCDGNNFTQFFDSNNISTPSPKYPVIDEFFLRITSYAQHQDNLNVSRVLSEIYGLMRPGSFPGDAEGFYQSVLALDKSRGDKLYQNIIKYAVYAYDPALYANDEKYNFLSAAVDLVKDVNAKENCHTILSTKKDKAVGQSSELLKHIFDQEIGQECGSERLPKLYNGIALSQWEKGFEPHLQFLQRHRALTLDATTEIGKSINTYLQQYDGSNNAYASLFIRLAKVTGNQEILSQYAYKRVAFLDSKKSLSKQLFVDSELINAIKGYASFDEKVKALLKKHITLVESAKKQGNLTKEYFSYVYSLVEEMGTMEQRYDFLRSKFELILNDANGEENDNLVLRGENWVTNAEAENELFLFLQVQVGQVLGECKDNIATQKEAIRTGKSKQQEVKLPENLAARFDVLYRLIVDSDLLAKVDDERTAKLKDRLRTQKLENTLNNQDASEYIAELSDSKNKTISDAVFLDKEWSESLQVHANKLGSSQVQQIVNTKWMMSILADPATYNPRQSSQRSSYEFVLAMATSRQLDRLGEFFGTKNIPSIIEAIDKFFTNANRPYLASNNKAVLELIKSLLSLSETKAFRDNPHLKRYSSYISFYERFPTAVQYIVDGIKANSIEVAEQAFSNVQQEIKYAIQQISLISAPAEKAKLYNVVVDTVFERVVQAASGSFAEVLARKMDPSNQQIETYNLPYIKLLVTKLNEVFSQGSQKLLPSLEQQQKIVALSEMVSEPQKAFSFYLWLINTLSQVKTDMSQVEGILYELGYFSPKRISALSLLLPPLKKENLISELERVAAHIRASGIAVSPLLTAFSSTIKLLQEGPTSINKEQYYKDLTDYDLIIELQSSIAKLINPQEFANQDVQPRELAVLTPLLQEAFGNTYADFFQGVIDYLYQHEKILDPKVTVFLNAFGRFGNTTRLSHKETVRLTQDAEKELEGINDKLSKFIDVSKKKELEPVLRLTDANPLKKENIVKITTYGYSSNKNKAVGYAKECLILLADGLEIKNGKMIYNKIALAVASGILTLKDLYQAFGGESQHLTERLKALALNLMDYLQTKEAEVIKAKQTGNRDEIFWKEEFKIINGVITAFGTQEQLQQLQNFRKKVFAQYCESYIELTSLDFPTQSASPTKPVLTKQSSTLAATPNKLSTPSKQSPATPVTPSKPVEKPVEKNSTADYMQLILRSVVDPLSAPLLDGALKLYAAGKRESRQLLVNIVESEKYRTQVLAVLSCINSNKDISTLLPANVSANVRGMEGVTFLLAKFKDNNDFKVFLLTQSDVVKLRKLAQEGEQPWQKWIASQIVELLSSVCETNQIAERVDYSRDIKQAIGEVEELVRFYSHINALSTFNPNQRASDGAAKLLFKQALDYFKDLKQNPVKQNQWKIAEEQLFRFIKEKVVSVSTTTVYDPIVQEVFNLVSSRLLEGEVSLDNLPVSMDPRAHLVGNLASASKVSTSLPVDKIEGAPQKRLEAALSEISQRRAPASSLEGYEKELASRAPLKSVNTSLAEVRTFLNMEQGTRLLQSYIKTSDVSLQKELMNYLTATRYLMELEGDNSPYQINYWTILMKVVCTVSDEKVLDAIVQGQFGVTANRFAVVDLLLQKATKNKELYNFIDPNTEFGMNLAKGLVAVAFMAARSNNQIGNQHVDYWIRLYSSQAANSAQLPATLRAFGDYLALALAPAKLSSAEEFLKASLKSSKSKDGATSISTEELSFARQLFNNLLICPADLFNRKMAKIGDNSEISNVVGRAVQVLNTAGSAEEVQEFIKKLDQRADGINVDLRARLVIKMESEGQVGGRNIVDTSGRTKAVSISPSKQAQNVNIASGRPLSHQAPVKPFVPANEELIQPPLQQPVVAQPTVSVEKVVPPIVKGEEEKLSTPPLEIAVPPIVTEEKKKSSIPLSSPAISRTNSPVPPIDKEKENAGYSSGEENKPMSGQESTDYDSGTDRKPATPPPSPSVQNSAPLSLPPIILNRRQAAQDDYNRMLQRNQEKAQEQAKKEQPRKDDSSAKIAQLLQSKEPIKTVESMDEHGQKIGVTVRMYVQQYHKELVEKQGTLSNFSYKVEIKDDYEQQPAKEDSQQRNILSKT